MTRHPRLAAKRDANEREIMDEFRARGCSVHQLWDYGDLLVGLGNPPIFIVVEVKKPGPYEMTLKEAQFRNSMRGAYEIVQSVLDVHRIVDKYRENQW